MSLIARQTRLWLNVVFMVGCLSVSMATQLPNIPRQPILGVKTFSNTSFNHKSDFFPVQFSAIGFGDEGLNNIDCPFPSYFICTGPFDRESTL